MYLVGVAELEKLEAIMWSIYTRFVDALRRVVMPDGRKVFIMFNRVLQKISKKLVIDLVI
jgi:hypothetical protein